MKIFRSTTPSEEKKSFLDNVRQNPKGLLKVIPTSLLIILPFCICLVGAFIFGLNYIRNDAYKYSDVTYGNIVAAIQGGEITDAEGNKEELTGCVQKNIGIDALELQKHVDKFSMNYENGQTTLVCSIKEGYFPADVTASISSDYTITKMTRNYDNLGEYMEHLIMIFGLVVLGATFVFFLIAEFVIFGGLYLYGRRYKKLEEKKKEQEADSSPQSNLNTVQLKVDTPAAS